MDVRVGVLRLGRMGDLVMTLPALRWLQQEPNVQPLLVMDERWRPLFPELPTSGPDPGPLPFWVDLHGTPAARRTLRRLRVGSVRRVNKESLRRRALIWGLPLRPRRTWPERHLEAVRWALDGELTSPRPAPVPQLEPHAAPVDGLLGLVPGAAHASKRWPIASFAELVRRWDGPARVFVGPGEEALGDALAAAGAEVWPAPLARLREGLSGCAVVVAGDTGPMHVAAAMGRPVVALFGPTPVDAGFWVWGDRGVVVRTEPGCAPCSMHGDPACPRRHHRCLVDLDVAPVLAAAEGLVA